MHDLSPETTRMFSQEIFATGPTFVPWPIRGDAYTVSSKGIVSAAMKEKSVYNFTNRTSPIDGLPSGLATDGRMCFYGLVDFIQRELTRPLTGLEVVESGIFLKNARVDGGPLDFDQKMWMRVVDEYKGYLPIRIEAVREGSTFWANEPVIQVHSLDKGFGEIAAIVEALLVGYVSNATARLTLTRHLLERVRQKVQEYNPTYTADEVNSVSENMIHDFGMRASSTPQEAEIYGRAHLLCFNTTDTFSAAYQAWVNNAKRPIGTSILALAHRIVMGADKETDAYEQLFQATKESVGSYVADCYDFKNAVCKFLTTIAKRRESCVVARPDSGDYINNVLFIVEEALKNDLYKTGSLGRPEATTLKFIQGSEMDWEKIQNVWDALDNRGVNPTAWGCFGIGGWLRNTPTRDTLSSAYKLCAVGEDCRPVIKLSDSIGKLSVPGPTALFRDKSSLENASVYLASETDDLYFSELVTYYDGGEKCIKAFKEPCLEDFNTYRERVTVGFDSYAHVRADRGMINNSPLSPAIKNLQKEMMAKHNKVYTR